MQCASCTRLCCFGCATLSIDTLPRLCPWFCAECKTSYPIILTSYPIIFLVRAYFCPSEYLGSDPIFPQAWLPLRLRRALTKCAVVHHKGISFTMHSEFMTIKGLPVIYLQHALCLSPLLSCHPDMHLLTYGMDHTNCLQVAIKSIQFNSILLSGGNLSKLSLLE
jgi:hypothetical protein